MVWFCIHFHSPAQIAKLLLKLAVLHPPLTSERLQLGHLPIQLSSLHKPVLSTGEVSDLQVQPPVHLDRQNIEAFHREQLRRMERRLLLGPEGAVEVLSNDQQTKQKLRVNSSFFRYGHKKGV